MLSTLFACKTKREGAEAFFTPQLTMVPASTMNVILTTGNKLGPYTIIESGVSTTCLAILITILTIVAILLYGMILKYILKQPKPRRDVDLLMLADQGMQGTSFTVLSIMVVPTLWTHQSVQETFGAKGCAILYTIQPVFLWSRLVGGLGVSTFRYIFMEHPDLIQKHGQKKIVKHIWVLEAFVISIMLALGVLSLISEQGMARVTICKGIPSELYETLQKHSKEEDTAVVDWIEMLLKSVSIPRLILVLTELYLNVKLIWSYLKSTNRIKASLSKKNVTKRHKKSAISLQGHLGGFFANLLFDVAVLVCVATRQFEPMCLYWIAIGATAFSNLATILASPELRREYLGDDDVLIPKKRVDEPQNNEQGNQDQELEEILDKMNEPKALFKQRSEPPIEQHEPRA